MTKEDLNNRHNSLKRIERLKSKKIITSLFDKKEGSFFVCGPITVAYKIIDNTTYNLPQVGFTVSKSKFKLAVDRNTIKRKMRSAYRTHKHLLLEKKGKEEKTLALMFIYNKKNIVDYTVFEKAMIELLKKF